MIISCLFVEDNMKKEERKDILFSSNISVKVFSVIVSHNEMRCHVHTSMLIYV